VAVVYCDFVVQIDGQECPSSSPSEARQSENLAVTSTVKAVFKPAVTIHSAMSIVLMQTARLLQQPGCYCPAIAPCY
jgi:hypothetical protein